LTTGSPPIMHALKEYQSPDENTTDIDGFNIHANITDICYPSQAMEMRAWGGLLSMFVRPVKPDVVQQNRAIKIVTRYILKKFTRTLARYKNIPIFA